MTVYGILLIIALYCVFVIIGIFMAINDKHEQKDKTETNIHNKNSFFEKIDKIKF